MNVDELIAANLGLVHDQLRKYYLTNDQDAESLAYEALYKAVISFDETKDTKLSTYATVFIYNSLGNHVRHLKRKRQLQIVSYNALIGEDGDEFVDFLSLHISAETEVMNKEREADIHALLDKMCCRLTNDTHKKIVHAWRKSNYTKTSTDIAKDVGVSQSYVSQVLATFRGNLREKLKED